MADVSGNLGAPVAIVQWPRDAARRDELRGLGLARLLLVATGAQPPDLDDDEDWVRLPAGERDVAARLAALRRRTGSVRLHDTTLHTARGAVVLRPAEAAVVAALLAAGGSLVARLELEAALQGVVQVRRRTLDDLVYRLRRRLRSVGLDVFTTRTRGYRLGPRLDWPVDVV